MAPSAQPSPQPFVRDRFTWLAYLMAAYFAYLQSGLGPAMPFLRTELGVSYTVGGLLISVFACGMILAGVVGDGLAAHWGRQRVFWGGGAGMAAGTICLMTSRQVAFTLLGTLIMGACGALLLVMIQATLADRHGPRRTGGPDRVQHCRQHLCQPGARVDRHIRARRPGLACGTVGGTPRLAGTRPVVPQRVHS